MGRRLNLPTPTVINTELIPLDESFYIEASGQLEQWYYDNTSQFAPNRRLAPLTLTPHISVFDGDTATSYTPSFYTVRWYENAYNASSGTYVETEIVNQTDSATADYVKSGNNLIVKKNVSYTRGVTIRCEATYIDPRDAGVTYVTGDSLVLSTNRDATVMYPKLDVLAPSAQSFNPLIDNSSQFQFKAVADATGIEVESVEQYRVDVGGTEQMLPENDTTVETCSPKLTIDYDGITQEDQVFTFRQTGGGTVPQPVSDTAKLMSMKGNTVKFNQLVEPQKFKKGGSSSTISTFTANTDGSYEITLSESPASNTSISGSEVTLYAEKIYYVNPNGGGYLGIRNPRTGDAYAPTIWSFVTKQNGICVLRAIAGAPTDIVLKCRPIVIDLTAIFGAGNEPSTVADFEAWLDANIGLKGYYPYDTGSLIPVKSTALKSVGFNLWNGTYYRTGVFLTNQGSFSQGNYGISNFIKVLPSSSYHIKGGSGNNPAVCWYDRNKEFIGGSKYGQQSSKIIDLPDNAVYIRVSIPDSTASVFAVNLSDPSRNGTYQAYWEDNVRLDITGITGINPTTGVREAVFPTGMKEAGTSYDEIYVENGAVKAVRRVGDVDLGVINWTYRSTYEYFDCSANSLPAKAKTPTAANVVSNLICHKYKTSNSSEATTKTTKDKLIWLGYSGYDYVPGGIVIRDLGYSDSSVFKTALSGVMLYYELNTPVVYTDLKFADGSPVTTSTVFEWYGISNNTEVKADTLPWYVSGQNTSTLTVDAMYGETIRVILRAKANTAATTLFPDKVYRTVEWRVPDIDTHVLSENGSAVRSNTNDMSFDTVINVMHAILSDEKKSAHLRFNWKTRKNNVSTEVDAGWGQTTTMDALDLRNTRGSSNSQLASTLVFPYVYLMGAYENCTHGGEEITQNGETVFDRPVL